MELTLKESQKLKFKSLILPSDWEDLDKWVDSLAKTLRSNYSKETLREYDRAVGWRAGMKRGWDNALLYYIDLILQIEERISNEQKETKD